MPPDPDVTLTATGESLYVRPEYGWGWARLDEGAPTLLGERARGIKMRAMAAVQRPAAECGSTM